MKRFMHFSAVAAALCACTAARAELVVYPDYPEQIERDFAYAVRVVQGGDKKMIPVYNHCEKSILLGRTRGGDVNRRFCEFAFSGGPVRVDIRVTEDVRCYKVFPSRLRLKSSFADGVISVWLEKPASFGIQLNDYDKTILSVFADAPEDPAKVPAKGAPGVLYVDRWLDAPGRDGIITTGKDVKEIYVAPGAVLNARLKVRGPGTYIHGRGMVLDPLSDVFRFDQTQNTTRGLLGISAPGVTVEDIKLVDARTFNYCSWAKNATYRNVRALSSMMCSDGITGGGPGLRVEGAWLYVGDNALVISGARDAVLRDVAIGTSCAAIFPQSDNYNVRLENIDVFRADDGLINNMYNGVLRRNNKWSEMNGGLQKREPGPQDLTHRTQQFHSFLPRAEHGHEAEDVRVRQSDDPVRHRQERLARDRPDERREHRRAEQPEQVARNEQLHDDRHEPLAGRQADRRVSAGFGGRRPRRDFRLGDDGGRRRVRRPSRRPACRELDLPLQSVDRAFASARLAVDRRQEPHGTKACGKRSRREHRGGALQGTKPVAARAVVAREVRGD